MLNAWPVVSATLPVTKSPMIWAAPETAGGRGKVCGGMGREEGRRKNAQV